MKVVQTIKKSWLDIFAVAVIVAVILFFFRKAVLSSGVFVSGNYNLSDFGDFFLPTRVFLARVLRNYQLPLWSADIGFGFPIMAEGQIQALFPLSILFLIFEPAVAYNLTIFFAVLFLALSTYLFLRQGLSLRQLPSLFASLAFSLGAQVTMHWQHVSLLWALAFFPLELLIVEKFFKNRNGVSLLVKLGLVVALQVLAGHPQTVAYTLLVVVLYAGYKFLVTHFLSGRLEDPEEPLITNRELFFLGKLLFLFLGVVFLALLIGGVQILPLEELLDYSTRGGSLTYEQSQSFPFYFKYLITLLVPFSFGDPSNWAPYLDFDLNLLVWEFCTYSGLLTTVFAFLAVSILPLNKEKGSFESFRLKRLAWFFSFLVLFSVLQARFNFLYVLPGFNNFRVPARFLIFLSFSVAVLSALFLEDIVYFRIVEKWESLAKPSFLANLPKNRALNLFSVLLVLLSLGLVGDLYSYLGEYNQTVSKSAWFEKPSTVSFLESNLNQARFLPVGEAYLNIVIYSKQRGWREDLEAYLDLQKLIGRNRSLIWDVPSGAIYTGLSVERTLNFLGFVHKGFPLDAETGSITPPGGMDNLLSFGGIKYIVSPLPIEGEKYIKVHEEDLQLSEHSVYIYELENALPRAYFVSKAKFASSEGESLGYILRGLADPRETVVLEDTNSRKFGEDQRRVDANADNADSADEVGEGVAEIVVDGDQEVVVEV
ncbi:MAG: hypothetical protein U9M98_03765, partial [Patescibacteria group bacterium]|nr:hypothetical protein [Patescibacteria group bacterium]